MAKHRMHGIWVLYLLPPLRLRHFSHLAYEGRLALVLTGLIIRNQRSAHPA